MLIEFKKSLQNLFLYFTYIDQSIANESTNGMTKLSTMRILINYLQFQTY